MLETAVGRSPPSLAIPATASKVRSASGQVAGPVLTRWSIITLETSIETPKVGVSLPSSLSQPSERASNGP